MATPSSILAWKSPWTEEPDWWATVHGVTSWTPLSTHICRHKEGEKERETEKEREKGGRKKGKGGRKKGKMKEGAERRSLVLFRQ